VSETMTAVPRCELAPDFTVSRIVTGLWQIADMERDGRQLDQRATADAMEPYVAAGLTTFDMADHYGSAEEIAGLYRSSHATPPTEFLTKWVPRPGSLTHEEVRAAVQRSLDRLGTSRLDLLQFHAWVYADPHWLDELFHLQELKEEGLIRHLGVTNIDTAHLRVILNSGIDVVSNQISFSLIDQRALHGMTELCEQSGVKLITFGAVAGGFLTERWVGAPEPEIEELSTWSMMKYKRFIDVAGGWEEFQNLLQVVEGVARRLNVSIPNVACRYVLDHPAVASVIIGARLGQRDHIRDNIRLFEFGFDNASRDEIAQAVARLRPIPGDCGDEYRRAPFLTASGDLSHHVREFPKPYDIRTLADGRRRVLTGTYWEEVAGFCRALRIGERILVSGTTATHRDRAIGGADPAAQAHFIIDKIEGAIISLGGTLEDVVRTRIYIRDLEDWEPVSRVHGERFRHVRPANTLVQAELIGDEYLVEIEAEAICPSE